MGLWQNGEVGSAKHHWDLEDDHRPPEDDDVGCRGSRVTGYEADIGTSWGRDQEVSNRAHACKRPPKKANQIVRNHQAMA